MDDNPKPPKVPATAHASLPQKYDAKSLRAALADHLTLSEAVDQVAKLLDQWPNGRKGVADGYIGALAAVLADYPRSVALRCCDPLKGVARVTEFLPTIATIVAFCEREVAAMRTNVERDDHYARLQAEMAERRAREEEDAKRKERETIAQLRARLGPNFGLRPMDDAQAKSQHVKAMRQSNERAYAKIGGTMSGDLLITEALAQTLKPEPDPQP